MSTKRVLVICLSEATLDLIIPWAQQGLLPTLQSWIREGALGRTAYGKPYLLTPQMWATICTGRSAGQHGIFDYWQRGANGRFSETHGEDLQAPSFWSHLQERERRVGVVNVPMTYPPHRVQGLMISGQDAPGSHPSIFHPRSLHQDLTQRFGRYHLKDVFPGGQSRDEYARMIPGEVERQTNHLEYLIGSQDCDFFMCYYAATAMSQHYFWDQMQAAEANARASHVVLETYQAVDRSLARLRAAAGSETTVFVISECGAGPLRRGVHLNAWLQREGYLEYRQAAGSFSQRRSLASRGVLSQIRKSAQKHLPKAAFYWANRSFLKCWIQERLAFSDIRWSSTRAYYRGKGEGNIYINLKGRDPQGIVQAGVEYEELCLELRERLLQLRDPDSGEPAVVAVLRASELYQGSHTEAAPDLVVEWKDSAYMPSESDRHKDQVFVDRWREYMNWPTTGSHRMHGLFLATGPGIQAGANLDQLNLLDLAPTFLHAMGVTPPEEYEGRVCREAFQTSASLAQQPDKKNRRETKPSSP